MNILTEILSSKVRVEIFCLLFGTINKELHMREIERRSGCAIGTIQTELKKLLRLDLVKKRKEGNRLYYQANKEHPLYPDIRSLVLKTIGMVDILKDVLRQDSDISIAFVFGSIARHDETVPIRKSTSSEPRQQAIYNALGLTHYPGRTIKKVVSA